MFIDLQKHHIRPLIPVIEARIAVLKKRVLKDHGSDWYDYDEAGIESKIEQISDEYFRLKQVLDELYRQPN